MSCNGFKTRNTCGGKTFATCVYIEGELPSITTLETADCYTLEEIVADTYLLLEGLKGEIEVDTLLGDTCLSYTLVEGKITVRQALKTMETEICDLKDKFDTMAKYKLCDIPIAGCDLELGALQTACGDNITSFGELMQAVINLGLVGAPADPKVFDIANDGTLTMTVLLIQPGETTQTIELVGGTEVQATIDVSKPVFITESAIGARGYIYIHGNTEVEIMNINQNFSSGLTTVMDVGVGGNPLIYFNHVS